MTQDIAHVQAALAKGDRNAAIKLAEAALASGLQHPLLYNLRALRAEAEGRWPDAVAALEQAVRLDPADPMLQNTLGLAYGRIRRTNLAIAAFGQAVDAAPDFYPAWRNLGMTQISAGDVFGARESFTRAAETAPQESEPPAQLAALAARRGDWTEAERLAQTALAIDPRHPTAVRAMAEVEMRSGRLDAASVRLEGWLATWRGPEPTRRLILGLLADVRDRQKRYAEAFTLYSLGNAEARRQAQASFGDGGLSQAMKRLSAATWRTPPAPFARKRAPEGPVRHIFLMGFMRSGTTLLEQALSVRDDVVTLEEREVLSVGVERYLSTPDGLPDLASAGEADLEPYREDYWRQVGANGVDPAGKVLVDKLPFNGVKLPLIRRLFPDAPIVFSVRDPRDVVLSCFRNRFAFNPYTFQLLELGSAAQFYCEYMALVETYLRQLHVPLMAYRHEDLVADYEGTVRKLCAYVGLSWRPEMSDVGLRVREGHVSSPSAVQLRDGLSREGLYGWKRYEAQLAPVLPQLQRWVATFGYASNGSMSAPWDSAK